MRVAFIHDWLGTYRGGEKVFEALLDLYPEAPIYTLFYQPGELPRTITSRNIRAPKYLGRCFSGRKILLPLLPAAVESFDFSQFDLLISSSSCVAKGAIAAPHAKHLCYIHSPMRYAWDQRHQYLGRLRAVPFGELWVEAIMSCMRTWDVQSCARVDRFVANSNFVGQRIRRYYGRDSAVVHPPIDGRFYAKPLVSRADRKPYLLCFGAQVGYKRFDLAVEAANRLKCQLIVAGSGPEQRRLRALAGGTVQFVSAPDDCSVIQLLGEAKALLFPGLEDFGMIPVEAMALGTPTIAYAAGGVLDSVNENSGLLFAEQTVDSLCLAISNFRPADFDPEQLRQMAGRFRHDHFATQMRQQISQLMGA